MILMVWKCVWWRARMTLGAAGGRAYSAFHDVDTANFVDAATDSTHGRAKKER